MTAVIYLSYLANINEFLKWTQDKHIEVLTDQASAVNLD